MIAVLDDLNLNIEYGYCFSTEGGLAADVFKIHGEAENAEATFMVLAPVGTASVIVANVLARVASATLNYNLNRCYVFRSDEGVETTAPRYALLAVSILAVNTLLLWLFVDIVGVPALVAKLCVELTLFVVNWVVQNRVVFRGREC